MNVLIAMDSFKGSLSSFELNNTIKKTLLTINNTLNITTCPIADGGEGTIEALHHLPHAKRMSLTVHNPLMRLVKAHYLMIHRTAIIEMAQAAGLTLLTTSEQNPLYTTTYGVGELIKDAIKHKAKSIIITVGGSATNDGGIGCLAALGYQFYDDNHTLLEPIGKNLNRIKTIKHDKTIHIPSSMSFHVACDVTNPLTGSTGAAYTYAKQKGATPQAIKALDKGLHHYMLLLKKRHPALNISQPGLGAAGGLPLSLMAFFNAEMSSGADLIFDILKIDTLIKSCDILITGEGKIDHQTLNNKAVYNILNRAHERQKPSIVLAGILEEAAFTLKKYGVVKIRSIHPDNLQLTEPMLSSAYTKKRLNITLKSLAHYFK